MGQTPDISIRYIRQEDYPDILSLANTCISKVLPDKEFEEDKIQGLFMLALANQDFTGICLTVDDRVKGFILGYITPYYFHSKKVAYCMAIFVEEKYRKYGYEMVKSFEAWGKYKKAETLSMSTFTNLSP